MREYDAAVVREMLVQGLDPNSIYQNDSLLHWAARLNADELAKVKSAVTLSWPGLQSVPLGSD